MHTHKQRNAYPTHSSHAFALEAYTYKFNYPSISATMCCHLMHTHMNTDAHVDYHLTYRHSVPSYTCTHTQTAISHTHARAYTDCHLTYTHTVPSHAHT